MLLVHNGGEKKRKEKKGKPFKTHEKKALKCPEGLSGQCFCSSLSQASKEQNPVIAIFHTFYVCVLCSWSLIHCPRAILGVTDTEQVVIHRIADKLTENSKLLPQTGIPQVFLALQNSPKVCWSRALPPTAAAKDALLHPRPLPDRAHLERRTPPFSKNKR